MNKFKFNRKSSRAFQRTIDGVRTLPLSPPKDGSKPIFQFFGIKFNFNRIKSATMFRCVKTSISRVVEQSISYEITKNIGRKVFPSTSTWNIGLNWPTPLLLARRMLSALSNYVMSKIQRWQLHSELFGRRHSTLQSHGLFALAKHLSELRRHKGQKTLFGQITVSFSAISRGRICSLYRLKLVSIGYILVAHCICQGWRSCLAGGSLEAENCLSRYWLCLDSSYYLSRPRLCVQVSASILPSYRRFCLVVDWLSRICYVRRTAKVMYMG